MFGRKKPVIVLDGLRGAGRSVKGLSAQWRKDADRIWRRALAAERRVAHRIHDGWEVAVPKAKRALRKADKRVKAASPHMAKARHQMAKGLRKLFA